MLAKEDLLPKLEAVIRLRYGVDGGGCGTEHPALCASFLNLITGDGVDVVAETAHLRTIFESVKSLGQREEALLGDILRIGAVKPAR